MTDFKELREALAEFEADPVKGDGAHDTFGYKCDPSVIRSLLKELDEARRDAERYRWLRDEVMIDGEINEEIYVAVNSSKWRKKWALVGKDLDKAIDAMKEQQP